MGFESKQINRKNSGTYLFLEMFLSWTEKNSQECGGVFSRKIQTLRLLH